MPVALAQSPAGPIEPVKLKRRQQRVWWRKHTNPDGNQEWIQTRPLPDDLESREIYRAKGFRMNPPGEDKPEDSSQTQALLEENARLRAMLQDQKRKTKRARKSKVKVTAPQVVAPSLE